MTSAGKSTQNNQLKLPAASKAGSYFIYLMRLIIIFLIALGSNFALPQKISGSVEYTVIIGEDKNLSSGELGDMFSKAKENASYLNYKLDFTPTEMSFYADSTPIDGIDVSFSQAFSGVQGRYYRKVGESEVLNLIDDYVLGKVTVKKDINVHWQLLNESKKIEGLECYKAVTTVKYNNGVGDFQKDLIAWYCPKIPAPFGPKGYGNLPGLILEFQDKNVVLGAKSIKLKENVTIKKPIGTVITEQEYSQKLQEEFKKREK